MGRSEADADDWFRLRHEQAMTPEAIVRLAGTKGEQTLTDKRLDALYDSYGPGAYDLPDQGYIAKVHPLDLWLLGYLINHPEATFSPSSSCGPPGNSVHCTLMPCVRRGRRTSASACFPWPRVRSGGLRC